jgi:hypothetical protein
MNSALRASRFRVWGWQEKKNEHQLKENQGEEKMIREKKNDLKMEKKRVGKR